MFGPHRGREKGLGGIALVPQINIALGKNSCFSFTSFELGKTGCLINDGTAAKVLGLRIGVGNLPFQSTSP